MIPLTENRLPVIVALDDMGTDDALEIARIVGPRTTALKINSLFVTGGPEILRRLKRHGLIFLDLKWHDIPQTVENYAYEATKHGIWGFTVHTLGGVEMMRAARRGVERALSEDESLPRPLILGITILTSHKSLDEIAEMLPIEKRSGYTVTDIVVHLAKLAKEGGLNGETLLDGVVCSPQEVAALRREIGDDFLLVTPGVRPPWYGKQDDQARTATPRAAMENGASFQVIGRPITKPPAEVGTPYEALNRIEEEIAPASV